MPSLALSPSMPVWHFGAPGPVSVGYPCPLHQLGPLDPWPTLADYIGARGALYSVRIFHQPRSQPVNRLLHPTKGLVPSSNTNNQNDLLLVNLTNPLTNITQTPGSLGWDSLLPPIIRSHHAFYIHPIYNLAR